MAWVPITNQFDTLGYSKLISDHRDGPLHFAAWITLLQLASRCKSRGLLVRDGGVPMTLADISVITRIAPSVYEAAIPRLAAIGWLEQLEELPQIGVLAQSILSAAASAVSGESGAIPRNPAQSRAVAPGSAASRARDEGNGMEGNGMEGKGREPAAVGGAEAPRPEVPPEVPPGSASETAPPILTEEHWSDFQNTAQAYGMRCSAVEWDELRRCEWGWLDHFQQMAAIDGLKRRLEAADWSLRAVVPRNYVKRRMWERRMRSAEDVAERMPPGATISRTRAAALEHGRRMAELEGRELVADAS